MPYREDDEAALARADALAVDLEQEKAEHERDKARIAELEAKLAAKPRDRKPDRQRAKPAATTQMPAPLAAFLVVLFVGGASVGVYEALRQRASDHRYFLPDQTTEAWKRATDWETDAEIQYVFANYVGTSGNAYLDRGHSELTFLFRSPHLADVDPHTDTFQMRQYCRFLVQANDTRSNYLEGSVASTKVRDWDSTSKPAGYCGYSTPGPLHCSFKQLWQRMIRDGADPEQLASFEMHTGETDGRVWNAHLVARGSNGTWLRNTWSHTYADDCTAEAP